MVVPVEHCRAAVNQCADGDLDLFVGGYAPSLFSSDIRFYENLEINCGDGIIDPSEVCDGAALGGSG